MQNNSLLLYPTYGPAPRPRRRRRCKLLHSLLACQPKDPEAPKRPISAYFFYMQTRRNILRSAYPELPMTRINAVDWCDSIDNGERVEGDERQRKDEVRANSRQRPHALRKGNDRVQQLRPSQSTRSRTCNGPQSRCKTLLRKVRGLLSRPLRCERYAGTYGILWIGVGTRLGSVNGQRTELEVSQHGADAE